MVKLSASRKKFILELFAVLVVCAFLAASLVPSIGHSGTGANSQSIFDVHSNPLPSGNNNSSSACYVKDTLVLSNNTLVKGNFINSGNGIHPTGVSFDSSNGYVYVTNLGSNIVFVINGATNKVIDNITVGSFPKGVSFDSSNGYVYVTNWGSNSVSVINGATNTVIDTITVSYYSDGISFDSSNGYVYVANYNSVSVINGATNKVIDTKTVGSESYGVSFDSSNGYVYVTNPNSNNVSVINGATNTVIDTIAVGSDPQEISFDSSNGYVYVANYNSGTISIIATPTTTSVSKYTVTFTETGLPSGTSWSVTLNGTSESSTTDTITFTEPNGTYPYTVSNVSGYSVSPLSGSITVSAKNFNQAITFTPTTTSVSKYTVTFTETGLPSGTTWYVNLSNGVDSGAITGTSYTFSLTNGTYSYTTSNVSGYSVSSSSGSITINGSSISISITYKATSTPPSKTSPSGISSTEIYGIIGAVIAVAAIGAGITVYRKRR